MGFLPSIHYLFTIFLFMMCTFQVFSLKSDLFQRSQCSNTKFKEILKAPSVLETTLNSTLLCAISCGRNTQCNFAVFRQSTNWCKHVFSYDGNSPSSLPSYTDEHQCFFLRKNNQPLCQNGGAYSGKICSCPKEYQGWECEETNTGFCQTSAWREIENTEYKTLTDSYVQMKMVLTQGSTLTVYNVPFFYKSSGTNYRLQLHNFLVVDLSNEDFEYPLKREFNFFYTSGNILTTVKMGMTGTSTKLTHSNPIYKLLIRGSMDNNRLFYKEGYYGSVTQLISGLTQGYRLLSREFSMVGWDEPGGDVYMQQVRNSVGASSTTLFFPLYSFTYKVSLKHKKIHIKRQIIKNGNQKSAQTVTKTFIWELDRCWTKLPSTIDPGNMVGILKDTVLSGQEIRLIMDGSVVTDVAMVTITTTDVVVAIADHLTNFNGVDPLDLNSKIRFSLVSLSKTLAECDMQFHGNTVYRAESFHYDSSLEWIIGSRPWTKVFTVASNGAVIFGSKNDVHTAATSGQNIRVCVEKTSVESACYGSITLTLTSDGHIMFQTPAVLRPDFDNDGTYSGNVDADCKRSVWLLSTKGCVRMASYVIGVATSATDLVSEPFLTMTWFKQN